ncbi:MAG: hypothetical protein M4579_000496 [Chaenotheca gracillima]|nr:MAG: hypothetical protein M4579_000496 [Chaenotheca gracillima]
MRRFDSLCVVLVALAALTGDVLATQKPGNSVLLSKVKTLTLRKDLKTSHRRVSAVPQLKCVGGDAKGLYDVDVMRCKNQGADYDDENIQWTCTASVPEEFKLGSTEVICEGYDSSEDPYILKGSCGVEYRLLLTDLGEEKYGQRGWESWNDFKSGRNSSWVSLAFWALFIGVLGWIIYSAYTGRGERRVGDNLGRGWGGGGGGGGGGWGAGSDDPPPPYDWQPPRKTQTSSARRATPGSASQQGWRPGFWSGAAGGAAAGYLFGQRGNTTTQQRGNGEGSSRWGSGGSGSGGSSSFPGSSSRHESTGFGSTSRR